MMIYTILTGETFTVQADSEEEALRIFAEHPEQADEQETRTVVIDEQEDPEPEPCDLCKSRYCQCDYLYDSWKESQLERD